MRRLLGLAGHGDNGESGAPGRLRQLLLRHAELVEERFAEHLSWMGGGLGWLECGPSGPSVVVDYLNIFRTRFRPTEPDRILLVDSDTVLPSTVSAEYLKSIVRWYSQVVQDLGLVEGVESFGGRSTK